MMIPAYKAKLVTPEEAVRVVKDGDWIDYGFAAGYPELLDRALAARKGELKNVKIRGGMVLQPRIEVVEADPEKESFEFFTWHVADYERKKLAEGRIQFLPMMLRYLPYYYRNGDIRVDVAFVPVSRPDENGDCTLSIATYAWKVIMAAAKTVIFEINEKYPRLPGLGGSNVVNISDADYIVEGEHSPLPLRISRDPSPIDIKVAENVIRAIPDGAMLGLGVGGVPATVASMLAQSDLKDLGCHTGTISDPYLALFKSGKLTNKNNIWAPGRCSMNLASGSQALYDWLEAEPDLFYPADLDFIHSPERMGQLKNYISINGGVQLDLMGAENAESIGTRQLSGIGGQMDFLEGAFRSVGGKGFICINSARKKKDGTLSSNIVPCIEGGSVVSAPRTMIQYVATEYGVAKLTGKSRRERAEAMIAIAHPDFRDQLAAYAAKL